MATITGIREQLHYRSQSIEETLTPLRTPPPKQENLIFRFHTWPEPEDLPEHDGYLAVQETYRPDNEQNAFAELKSLFQEVLLLHAPKQKYTHTKEHPIPSLENDREMLVEVEAVGLNPIDWKAPDFGWGLPTLPCISGRDLAGKIVKIRKPGSRFRVGDKVMAVSTDYRDSRKSAYQQYSVVSDFNACRIPEHLSARETAPLGVAFVAAALGLGICMGLDFASSRGKPRGPDLLKMVRSLTREGLPKDIREECFDRLGENERAKRGDWIAIWGGSSATGCAAVQIAKLAGLKVIAVVDLARSGERMLKYGADLLIDRLDTDRAVSILRAVTNGKLRFGLDTRGKESAALLAQAMKSEDGESIRTHLVGLTGSPKEPTAGVTYHSVPIKAFHEAPCIGESMMVWLEQLLAQNLLLTPDIEVAGGGLEGINAALDKLRDGSVNGPRIVVPLKSNFPATACA